MAPESISFVKYNRLKKTLDEGLDHFDYFIDACVLHKKSFWYINRYYKVFKVRSISFDSLVKEFDKELSINFINNLENGEVLDEYIKKVYLELRYIHISVALHTHKILKKSDRLKSEYLLQKILSVPMSWFLCLEDRLDEIEKIAEHRDIVLDRYCENVENIFSIKYTKSSNFQKEPIKREPAYTEFADWLTEEGKVILPTIAEKYQNAPPRKIAALLYALEQTGLMETKVSVMNRTMLHAQLCPIFGKIGTRQALDHALDRYEAADQKQESDIRNAESDIKKSLINR